MWPGARNNLKGAKSRTTWRVVQLSYYSSTSEFDNPAPQRSWRNNSPLSFCVKKSSNFEQNGSSEFIYRTRSKGAPKFEASNSALRPGWELKIWFHLLSLLLLNCTNNYIVLTLVLRYFYFSRTGGSHWFGARTSGKTKVYCNRRCFESHLSQLCQSDEISVASGGMLQRRSDDASARISIIWSFSHGCVMSPNIRKIGHGLWEDLKNLFSIRQKLHARSPFTQCVVLEHSTVLNLYFFKHTYYEITMWVHSKRER